MPSSLITGALLLFLAPSLLATATVSGLRCEDLENPLGIDARQPRLGWVLASDERGQRQTAYQILVASDTARLKPGRADLWDSGKVESAASLQIRYAGQPLVSHAECFWQVRVWDRAGRASAWSRPAHWTMGLLDPAEWRARWIGREGEATTNYLAGTSWIWLPDGGSKTSAEPGTNRFRRVVWIPADREIRSARFDYTGESDCRGWINDLELPPRSTVRNARFNDLTTRIEPGQTNVFVLESRPARTTASHPGVIGRIEIQFTTGDPIVIATDEQWRVSDQETPGCHLPGFDDSAWTAAKTLGPAGAEPWGEVRAAESRRLPARWLRKEFTLDKPIRRATVSCSGLGLSELYLNGARVGDHVLSPGLTDYSNRVLYVTFDVTRQLRRGQNALGVVLGNGRFFADRSRLVGGTVSYGFPKLLLQLRVEHPDGSVSEIVSDDSWRLTTDGPILANSEFDGEEYDARKELKGWAEPGFDHRSRRREEADGAGSSSAGVRLLTSAATSPAAAWQPAQIVPAPSGRLAAQMIAPIRVIETLKPVAITEPKPGVFIFDLGQNLVGWCRLQVRGPAGTTVRLRHAETLRPDGTLYFANLRNARVTDYYTLKGGSAERWEPRFTYHGFRYVEVTGYPGRPARDAITGCVVHDDLPAAGEFECSNPLLNRIYRNVVWGVRGNYRSIPTDCPQRDERQGWLGDRSEVSRGEMYLFDNQALYSKWLQDMADAQRPSGSVPDVCPPYWQNYRDNVTWPSSTILIPDSLRRQFGNEAIIARHYDSAQRWLDHMQQFVTNGIIAKDNYGDWCVPPEDLKEIRARDPNRLTDKALLATAYFYHDLRLMERFAQMLGKQGDAARFGEQAEAMKAAFNERFLKSDLGRYDNGTQTSSLLPLAFGLAPDDQRERVFAQLVDKIENESKGHIGTGLIGAQYLLRVLSDNGRPDLACTIASQPDYPGWGYMVSRGATTIWELWNGDTAAPSMNSGNHVMMVGDLVIWLYECLAGIAPDDARPGFQHLVMKPQPVGDLTFVKASHRTPYGWAASAWQREGKTFRWQVTVPPNTSATVYVPATRLDAVKEGRKPAVTAKGVQSSRHENGRAIFEIESGKYEFASEF